MLVAGYIGFPYIFYRKENGEFDSPQLVKDEKGNNIHLGMYYDNAKGNWTNVRGKHSSNITMVRVVDWDNDGDLDLILSSHPHGGVHQGVGIRLVRNLGNKTKPVFSEKQEMIIDTPCLCAFGITDWDGDGLWDILAAGTEHEEYIGIYWYKNRGTKDSPKFDKSKVVFSKKDLKKATGYDFHGIFATVTDYNSDGKQDILIGSTSFKREVLKLTRKQKKDKKNLAERRVEVNKKYWDLSERVKKDAGLKEEFEKTKKERGEIFKRCASYEPKILDRGYLFLLLKK